ncbi:hypothetical protein ACFOVU_16460 [Nocardiopsis sediminis]|uniref:Uncharacterized protein n=1 Tax=Nocardiopsis sediminis TaxID=1778267 RepID=A0ABV8FRD0_9ACTN
MRHFIGFLVGLMLAPVVMLATGWVLPRLVRAAEDAGGIPTTGELVTLGVLGGVALLLGLALVPPRLTPLVPGIAGLSLIGITTVAMLRPELLGLIPSVPGREGALTLLSLGLYLPLSLVLVVPLFVGARWSGTGRRDPVTEEEYFDGLYDEDYEDSGRAPRHAATAPQPRGATAVD